MSFEELNLALQNYDTEFYIKLEAVLETIASKSKALASNLKDCIKKLELSDRYSQAYSGFAVAVKESDLSGDEFEIFRKYVRLLRSCTIMCGQETANEYKKLFIDFFSGTRLKLAQDLGKKNGVSKDQKEKIT